MGTKSTQTQTGTFDPGSMQAFQQLTGAMSPVLQGYINSPFSNPFFQTQQQLGTRQAQNLGQTGVSNIMRNASTAGIGGSAGTASPFQQEMLQNQNRANTGLQAQLGFLSPVMNALQLQQNALGGAEGYRPFQTGGTQVGKTSGLGTWLPQLASAGLGAFGAAMGGGFGGGGGGSQMSAPFGTFGAMNAATSPMQAGTGQGLNWFQGPLQEPNVGLSNYGGFQQQSPFFGGMQGPL